MRGKFLIIDSGTAATLAAYTPLIDFRNIIGWAIVTNWYTPNGAGALAQSQFAVLDRLGNAIDNVPSAAEASQNGTTVLYPSSKGNSANIIVPPGCYLANTATAVIRLAYILFDTNEVDATIAGAGGGGV